MLPLDILRALPFFIGEMAGITGRRAFFVYGSFVYVVTRKRVREDLISARVQCVMERNYLQSVVV